MFTEWFQTECQSNGELMISMRSNYYRQWRTILQKGSERGTLHLSQQTLPQTRWGAGGTNSQESVTQSWDHMAARSGVQHPCHPADEDRSVGQKFQVWKQFSALWSKVYLNFITMRDFEMSNFEKDRLQAFILCLLIIFMVSSWLS